MNDRQVIWTSHDRFSTEHVTVRELPEGWLIDGAAISVFDSAPAFVQYQITCDSSWLTSSVNVSIDHRSSVRAITAAVSNGRWTINGNEYPEFDGCVDIDLGITPFTNTLPIRRLKLAIEESAPAAAVWVQFPTLAIEILRQTYTRLSESTYRYESSSGFTADLIVDTFGIVTEYGDLWSIVASNRPIA
ncbi:putative glycolipid-binding domain-containing protein [soil metagenome]